MQRHRQSVMISRDKILLVNYDPDVIDVHTWSKLHGSACVNNMAVVLNELKSTPVDRVDGYGQIPLWWSVERDNYDMVKLLLDNGADVNKKDIQGVPPIHNVRNEKILKLLLNGNADIGMADSRGNTLMHKLAEYPFLDDVTKINADMIPVVLNNIPEKEINNFLNKKNNSGKTAYDVACNQYSRYATRQAFFKYYDEHNISHSYCKKSGNDS